MEGIARLLMSFEYCFVSH